MGVGEHSLPDAAGFTHECRTGSAAETQALGRRMAGLLTGGEIILLYGDLGMGKTCLVQGICAELAVTAEVVSPTFTLVNTYEGRLVVHHLDFYRLGPEHDLMDVGVPDLLDEIWDGRAVGLIEWPGPVLAELGAAPRLEILAAPGDHPDARTWHLRGLPEVPLPWLELFDPKGHVTC